ncbi:ABC transporter ATP-binding protein [soil metagenome]
MSHDSKEAALAVNGISKSFGPVEALKNVSLQLNRGEFLTMLGPSGSGKTTMLRVIAGFITPDSGEVKMHGRDVLQTPPYRRNIGMVFQDYALFPHMTVLQNIGFPLEARGASKAERRKRAESMLDVVGLANFGGRYPRQLSGGQQQRVALARALVFDPEIVLLDEPLGALDKKLRGSMQLEILRIVRQLGMTVISVTHDQEEALVMSDRIALFSQGELVQAGAPRELYENPRTEFVADFVGEANILKGRYSSQPPPGMISGDGWCAEVPATAREARHRADGSPAILIVRPENVAITPIAYSNQPQDAPNRCEATIRDCVYLGVEFRAVVVTDAGETIQVRSRNIKAMHQFIPGQRVSLSWDPADCVIL